jgi:ABC transport system ATP-binding/permease protein
MNYISAESVSKAYEDKWLFKNISFGLSRGQKVALIGINGSGKSTLLKTLAGIEKPDEGTIAVNKEITLAYLHQDPDFKDAVTISDALFSKDNPVLRAISAYEKALTDTTGSKALQNAMEEMDALNAWDYEQKVKEYIGKLNIPDMNSQLKMLSGGQKKRVALAQLLIQDPDLLILDEPTNHLDLDTIEWLQDFLSSKNTTLLMVTHDRYFLEAVTNEIIELDHANLYSYHGNYSYFLEKKAERHAQAAAETDKAKNLMRKELDWIRRQPKARGTKAKYRVEAFEELKEKATTQITEQKLELQVKAARQGNKVIEIENLAKGFDGRELISNFSYIFKKGERIGIVGKNGTGKSTFLNMLTGLLSPDKGKISVGETTKIGFYRQEGLKFDESQRVIDIVKEVAEVITLSNNTQVTATKFLELFGFDAALQYSFVSKLSGGEKKRLQLLKVLMANPNFLILDEPSNDLDIVTLNVLEEFLQAYPGCLLIVSHDRFFLDQLADHLFIFEGNGVIRDFNGNYTDYRFWLKDQEEEKKPKPQQAEKTVKQKSEPENKKLSFKEKKEFEDLEVEIAKLEFRKEELIEKMTAGTPDHNEMRKISDEMEKVTEQIDEKTLRWLELADKKENQN